MNESLYIYTHIYINVYTFMYLYFYRLIKIPYAYNSYLQSKHQLKPDLIIQAGYVPKTVPVQI